MLSPARFSTDVRLSLLLNGNTYDLAWTGHDSIGPREPLPVTEGDAVVLMTVDGEPRRWNVRLCGEKDGKVMIEDCVLSETHGEFGDQKDKKQ